MSGRDGFSEKYVLILQSAMAGNRAQTANSDMAVTILRAKGIQPTIMDASDPQNKERRDKLFEISGFRGNFPQIFKVNGKETTFLGDFDTLQSMNEDGMVVELAVWVKSTDDIGSEQPPVPVRVASTNPSLDSEEDSVDEESSEDLEDDSDNSDETITSQSEGDAESGNFRNDDDEGVTRAMREFEERKKIEDARKYRKLIQILVVAVCLFLILDTILVVLIVVN